MYIYISIFIKYDLFLLGMGQFEILSSRMVVPLSLCFKGLPFGNQRVVKFLDENVLRSGGKDLSRTAEYPPAFGAKVAMLHQKWLELTSGMNSFVFQESCFVAWFSEGMMSDLFGIDWYT